MKVSRCASHPLRVWRDEKGLTPEEVSKRVIKHGGRLSPRTIGEIEGGRRRPSYELAKILVKVSRDAFTVDQLKTWKSDKRNAA
jgi:transcriptional regulator with XRE-family HTH domain